MGYGNVFKGGLDSSIRSRKVKVYDVKNKKLIKEFDSVTQASHFTGVLTGNIQRILKTKGRSLKNKLGIIITFR
jgi:hypothetical protein